MKPVVGLLKVVRPADDRKRLPLLGGVSPHNGGSYPEAWVRARRNVGVRARQDATARRSSRSAILRTGAGRDRDPVGHSRAEESSSIPWGFGTSILARP
jgi:hypothetical protein